MLRRAADPIVAVATASGRGAIGIVRISGRGLGRFATALIGRPLVPRVATYTGFADATGSPIDHGLALWFPAPNSATGEDVLELQAHGGPVVLQLLVARCLEVAAGAGAAHQAGAAGALPGAALLPDLRLAESGEFTERAFLNDKLDLAQAEAVADLIDASTEAAARSASRSLAGAFSDEIGSLRDALIDLRMLVEATLDFPEEEVDFLEKADARGRLGRIDEQVARVLDRARQGVLLRDGIRIVIAGQPNVGKSSLLNALAGAELAIVTPIAGTTRDKISSTIQIEGVPVQVTDTAGLREAADEVEQAGIARSWAEIETADAVLWLHDLTRLDDPEHQALDAAIAERLPPGLMRSARLLQVFNKADAAPLGGRPPGSPALAGSTAGDGSSVHPPPTEGVPAGALRVSARTGEGLEGLRRRLLELAGWQPPAEGVFMARSRHLEALRRTAAHLDRARQLADRRDAALDLLAEDLRLAHDALGEITGAFSADDLLGEIFGRFCIGK